MYNVFYRVMARLVAYFHLCLYMVDSMKLLLVWGLSEAFGPIMLLILLANIFH